MEDREVEDETGKQPPAQGKINNTKATFPVLALQQETYYSHQMRNNLGGGGNRNTCPNVRSSIKLPPAAK